MEFYFQGCRTRRERYGLGADDSCSPCQLRNVLRIVNEPTAAAIAYGLDAKSKDKKKGAES